MMSDSQEQIRQIFSLNNEEKILDDFGCSIVETINIPGRLYLTEHYICFNSNLFGLNRKYSIPFLDIIELKIKKSNIEIDTKNLLKKKFAFTSFTDIQIVYKRLKSMCRSYNENISITTDSQNEVMDSVDVVIVLACVTPFLILPIMIITNYEGSIKRLGWVMIVYAIISIGIGVVTDYIVPLGSSVLIFIVDFFYYQYLRDTLTRA